MDSCKIRETPATPFNSIPFWMVIGFVWLDLSLTMVGIVQGMGSEANPFFVPFTLAGDVAMFGGIAFYFLVIFAWFWYMPSWLRAITAGFLTTIHIWGAASWLRMWFESFDIFFSVWYMLVGVALAGSVLTFWTYVDMRSCFENREEPLEA